MKREIKLQSISFIVCLFLGLLSTDLHATEFFEASAEYYGKYSSHYKNLLVQNQALAKELMATKKCIEDLIAHNEIFTRPMFQNGRYC